MRIYLIGFFIITIAAYSCSLNGMFLYPVKTDLKDIRKKYFDVSANDSIIITTTSDFRPLFSKANGKMYVCPFDVRTVFFPNAKGDTLQGWIFKADPEINNGINIFFLHGNAGNVLSHVTIIKPLVEKGCNVFIFDYAGFGKSQGKSKRKNLPADAQAALEFYLKQEESKAKKTFIYGQSLGGHLALEVAKNNQEKISGVIIEGTFTNHDEIGAEVFKPGFIAKIMIREFYNGKKNIRKINKPVLVAHSVNDETIPFYMGEELYKNANEPKQFLKMEKCHVCGPIYYSDSIVTRIKKMIE